MKNTKFRKTLEIPYNIHIRALKISKELVFSYTAFINLAIQDKVNKEVLIKFNRNENRY